MSKGKKWTYEEVSDYFKEQGCELKTPKEEYINTKQNLDYICSCGNPSKITFSKFKDRGQRCKECGKKKLTKNKTLTYDEVKKYVESLNYKLISKEYKNNRTKLILKDNEEYYLVITYSNLLTGYIPSKFHINNPYTIQNIKLWLKLNNKNFELLSEKYEGIYNKLIWKCLSNECNEEFDMDLTSILSGYNCPCCSGRRVCLSNCLAFKNPELAFQWHSTKNGNLTPWDVTFKSNQYAWWKCDKGHEWPSTIDHRSDGNGCPECNNSKGEKEIDRVLIKFNISHDSQYIFKNLFGLGGGLLRFDSSIFWDKEKTQLKMLIEYDGEFHFRWVPSMMTKEEYYKLQQHDIIKNLYCVENNIQLIRIPYWEYDNIEKYLRYYLIENSEFDY